MSCHVFVLMFKGIVHSKTKFGHYFSPSCLSKIFSFFSGYELDVKISDGSLHKDIMWHCFSTQGWTLLSCHAQGNIWTRAQPSCGLEYNTVI